MQTVYKGRVKSESQLNIKSENLVDFNYLFS